MAENWWHPEAVAARLPALRVRSAVAAALRAAFRAEGFTEVETPILQVCPGMEPHLRVFATEMEDAFGEGRAMRYLHTSPEFAMKKLLAAGLPRIFQFARVFRNGETSPTHHPEFTMLEWYRAGADYTALMDDCARLLAAAAGAAGREEVTFRGVACRLDAEPQRISVPEAFSRFAGIDLMAALADQDAAEPDPAPLAAEARRIGISVSPSDRWEDVFFKVMLEAVEPRLGAGAPTVLYDYPVCQAALSRRKPGEPRLAERFELYAAGVELANGFSELTDAAEQEKRFLADAALKRRLYGTEVPIDRDFLDALAFGMPESAGIALGVDRLVMLCAGAENIADVLWAPVV
ncbi:EF-P lysine aminoacylase EpmA [Oleispirillum naphthae]|uniref:EF-P lysine aminoacylase EpmA n=1 Tax=Oleispirillum naphthae TaxID=2838853 RepID=UPI00308234D1